MVKKKQKHLGKGLQALLGPISMESATDTSIQSEKNNGASQLKEISLSHITPNPHQPRKVWDEGELTQLVDSIKANGVIQPIILRDSEDGYQLIAGERRWRASKIAELKTIPAIVRNATESQMIELALVENIHRSNLNPIERAQAYKLYIEQFNLTQSQAAERLGESRPVVANFIRLLDLPSEIQSMLINSQLSMGHARAILAIPSGDIRKKIANMALAGRLSVREIEKLVKKHLSGKSSGKTVVIETSPHILDLESKLRGELGTKVQIKTNKDGKKGRIVIDFFSLDEFERLTERMGVHINTCE